MIYDLWLNSKNNYFENLDNLYIHIYKGILLDLILI
jgi:hypothetical protein